MNPNKVTPIESKQPAPSFRSRETFGELKRRHKGAARFHGVERGVDDLDVVVDSKGRAEALRAAISEVGIDIDVTKAGEPYKRIPLKNLRLCS